MLQGLGFLSVAGTNPGRRDQMITQLTSVALDRPVAEALVDAINRWQVELKTPLPQPSHSSTWHVPPNNSGHWCANQCASEQTGVSKVRYQWCPQGNVCAGKADGSCPRRHRSTHVFKAAAQAHTASSVGLVERIQPANSAVTASTQLEIQATHQVGSVIATAKVTDLAPQMPQQGVDSSHAAVEAAHANMVHAQPIVFQQPNFEKEVAEAESVYNDVD